MSELRQPGDKEKIASGSILLLAEPIFHLPKDQEKYARYPIVPVGSESWVLHLPVEGRDQHQIFAEEYFSIATALKELDINFKIIVAHREELDEKMLFVLFSHLKVRGLGLDKNISSLGFPRDMLEQFGTDTYINPDANFTFPDNSGIISPLGEGGRVLKKGKKVLVPLPESTILDVKQYAKDIDALTLNGYEFGFLPLPIAAIFGAGKKIDRYVTNDHLDRVGALIRGKDGNDHLLLDSNYVESSVPSLGNYWQYIERTCERLRIIPRVIPRIDTSIPYALNLEQFEDNTVLMTGGDDILRKEVETIVGSNKVKVTSRPIIYYPIFRRGGIRCMLLVTPGKIVR